MKRTYSGISLLLLLTSSLATAQTVLKDCESSDKFICALNNPEDLLPITGTSYVMISSMENNGRLYVTHSKDLHSSVVFPADNAKQEHDKEKFPNCPGPLSSIFRPHGLALREGKNNIHTLYVVGHGEREAIEVFQLDTNSSPVVTWQGCVVAPKDVSLNSVAPLPNGAFATTNFNLDGGEVWEWQIDSGWAKVPGSDMLGPNGIISSPDGKWLYIGGWHDEALIRLSRGLAKVEKQMIKVDFHIDNVRWGNDGKILVAGQKGLRTDIAGCLYQGNCEKASTGIALIDEKTMSVEASKELPVEKQLKLGTVAIDIDGDIWVGGIAGSNYLARFRFAK